MSDQSAAQVLVVHNNKHEAAQFQQLLEHEGCAAESTWSGLDALDLLRKGRFDVLLTDSYVPDLYVGELIERASRLPLPPRILVLRDLRIPPDLDHYQAAGLCEILDKSGALLQAVAARETARKQPPDSQRPQNGRHKH